MEYLIIIAFCLATAFFARAKGFNPLAYLLAGGPAGLLLLGLIPSARIGRTSESNRARREVGDKLGFALSGISVLAMLIWLMI